MEPRQNERRSGQDRRERLSIGEFKTRIRLTLEELEKRKDYRIPIAQFVKAAQIAASNGFRLQVVSAGSMFATVALCEDELKHFADGFISLMLDE